MKPETRLTNDILKELRRVDRSFWFKIHGGSMQTSGIPDIIGVCRGQFYAFEVKMEKGVTSPRQDYIMGKIDKAGGIVRVVTSVEQVLAIVKEAD